MTNESGQPTELHLVGFESVQKSWGWVERGERLC
jgi:hypothetical protein